jgi:hypothetical protein
VVQYAAWKVLFFHGQSGRFMSLVNHHCLRSRLRMSIEIPLLSICLYGVPWKNITCTCASTDLLNYTYCAFYRSLNITADRTPTQDPTPGRVIDLVMPFESQRGLQLSPTNRNAWHVPPRPVINLDLVHEIALLQVR